MELCSENAIIKYERYIRLGYETVFLVYLGIYAFIQFYKTVFFHFPSLVFDVLDIVTLICKCILGIGLIISIVGTFVGLFPKWHFFRWKWYEMIIAVIVSGILWASGTFGEYKFLAELGILVITAHNVNFKKVTGVFCAITAAFFIATVIFTLAGVLTNLSYPEERTVIFTAYRYAMGFVYPTDCCAHLFFCICCYLYTRGVNIHVWEIIVIAVATILVCIATLAYLNTICNVILILFAIYIKLKKKKKGRFTLCRGTQAVCIASYPVTSVGIIGLTYCYKEGSKIWDILNKVLHWRLYNGHKAFDNYNVRLFDQYIDMNGNGWTTDVPDAAEYFYLDSSYVNILFRQGLIVFMTIIGSFVIIECRMQKYKNYIGMFIFAVIALQCMMEHHLIELFYSPALLALTASLKPDNCRQQY